MRIVGFMALHYGADYIQYAIESIIDHVDVFHIAYSPVGSHGARTQVACPEPEKLLKALAHKAAGNKLVWHRGEWPHEGKQRDMIYEYEPDADIIVIVDSDEVWGREQLDYSIEYVITSMGRVARKARTYRVPMVHYWRSFRRCITQDTSYPVRLICPKQSGEREIPNEFGYINHFGYAIRPSLMRYKWLIHGHRGEYRTSWFDEVYLNKDRQDDLHPVGSDSWNFDVINPLDYMPDWMQSHPFYNMEWIE